SYRPRGCPGLAVHVIGKNLATDVLRRGIERSNILCLPGRPAGGALGGGEGELADPARLAAEVHAAGLTAAAEGAGGADRGGEVDDRGRPVRHVDLDVLPLGGDRAARRLAASVRTGPEARGEDRRAASHHQARPV